MKLLLDMNVVPQITSRLVAVGHACRHARDIGLARAADTEIIKAASDDLLVLKPPRLSVPATHLPSGCWEQLTLARVMSCFMLQFLERRHRHSNIFAGHDPVGVKCACVSGGTRRTRVVIVERPEQVEQAGPSGEPGRAGKKKICEYWPS